MKKILKILGAIFLLVLSIALSSIFQVNLTAWAKGPEAELLTNKIQTAINQKVGTRHAVAFTFMATTIIFGKTQFSSSTMG
jgi:hypothetical protein